MPVRGYEYAVIHTNWDMGGGGGLSAVDEKTSRISFLIEELGMKAFTQMKEAAFGDKPRETKPG